MKARLEAIGDTVYQSPGSSAADKNAVAAAHSVYGGFWGPWEGLAPTPSPTPPVAGKFHLVLADGKTCLRAESLTRAGALGVGACDGHAELSEDNQGHLYNTAAKQPKFSFLRPADKYPKCINGDGTRLGELTSKGIGATLEGSRIVLTTCKGGCVGRNGQIASCSEASAGAWQKQRILTFV